MSPSPVLHRLDRLVELWLPLCLPTPPLLVLQLPALFLSLREIGWQTRLGRVQTAVPARLATLACAARIQLRHDSHPYRHPLLSL